MKLAENIDIWVSRYDENNPTSTNDTVFLNSAGNPLNTSIDYWLTHDSTENLCYSTGSGYTYNPTDFTKTYHNTADFGTTTPFTGNLGSFLPILSSNTNALALFPKVEAKKFKKG